MRNKPTTTRCHLLTGFTRRAGSAIITLLALLSILAAAYLIPTTDKMHELRRFEPSKTSMPAPQLFFVRAK